MQANETTSNSQSLIFPAKAEHRTKHRYRFSSVKDSRNRKVRGLWKRGVRLYMQTRVAGERSARKIPLKSTTLEAARAEMADAKKQKRMEGLPDTGLRPLFADYARNYLKFGSPQSAMFGWTKSRSRWLPESLSRGSKRASNRGR